MPIVIQMKLKWIGFPRNSASSRNYAFWGMLSPKTDPQQHSPIIPAYLEESPIADSEVTPR